MAILDIFRRDKSAKTAKKRLTMVLSYERNQLPPNFTEMLQQDLVQIFSKYPQFQSDNIEVDLRTEGETEELWISIPLVRK